MFFRSPRVTPIPTITTGFRHPGPYPGSLRPTPKTLGGPESNPGPMSHTGHLVVVMDSRAILLS